MSVTTVQTTDAPSYKEHGYTFVFRPAPQNSVLYGGSGAYLEIHCPTWGRVDMKWKKLRPSDPLRDLRIEYDIKETAYYGRQTWKLLRFECNYKHLPKLLEMLCLPDKPKQYEVTHRHCLAVINTYGNRYTVAELKAMATALRVPVKGTKKDGILSCFCDCLEAIAA